MLNDDKIRLMTGIAMFEKREGKRIFPVNRYFKGDYISSHMFRSFFAYTVSFLMCTLVWSLYSIEDIFNSMSLVQFRYMAVRVGLLYFAGLVFYMLVTVLVYRKRYEYAKRGMKVYLAKLKRLEKRYEFQTRSKELSKGGRPD